MEGIRLGTGHLGYRALRLPWSHHRFEIFVIGVVLFWLVAAAERWELHGSSRRLHTGGGI
jgi:hypothetical protein